MRAADVQAPVLDRWSTSRLTIRLQLSLLDHSQIVEFSFQFWQQLRVRLDQRLIVHLLSRRPTLEAVTDQLANLLNAVVAAYMCGMIWTGHDRSPGCFVISAAARDRTIDGTPIAAAIIFWPNVMSTPDARIASRLRTERQLRRNGAQVSYFCNHCGPRSQAPAWERQNDVCKRRALNKK
jgi:hypothetical protein